MSAVVPLDELPAHLAACAERAAAFDDDAVGARLTALTQPLQRRRQALGDRALRARSAAAKVQWLREEADLVGRAVAPVSPCRAGCSYCCHQGVSITRSEAEIIAKETGHRLAEPAPERMLAGNMVTMAGEDPDELRERVQHLREWMVDAYNGVACTFLDGAGRCSIYAQRPVACRLHISVDHDALRCRPIPDSSNNGPVRVPYVDVRQEQMLYVTTFGDEVDMADIRDWFPKEAQT